MASLSIELRFAQSPASTVSDVLGILSDPPASDFPIVRSKSSVLNRLSRPIRASPSRSWSREMAGKGVHRVSEGSVGLNRIIPGWMYGSGGHVEGQVGGEVEWVGDKRGLLRG